VQRILYEEDELGVLLAEKERQIGRQEDDLRRLNQLLSTKERELHSVQSNITHKEREKAFMEEQLTRLQAELLRKERELTALRERDRSEAMERQFSEARRQVESLQQEKAQLQTEQERLTTEVERKEVALEEKREQILQAKGEVDRVMGELTEARQTITRLRSQLDTATEGLHQRETQLTDLVRLEGVERELEAARRDNVTIRCENARLRNLNSARPPPQPLGLHIELPLSFTPTNAAAFGVHSAKAVMFGNSVVVAGGHADVDSQQQVMFYRPDRRVWNTLGKYNLSLFAMAVLGDNRMLVLVGGYNLASDTYSNNLVQWDQRGRYWRPTFRPMPTPRSDAAAVGYKSYLVVAGGSNGEENLTVVEVLNTHTVQWSIVAPLPAPIEGLIQNAPLQDATRPEIDTWYLMGWETGLRQPAHTFAISLHQLILELEGGESTRWAMLPPPPLACCGAVIFRGCLLAVGGKDRHGGRKKDIHLYLPGTCEWLRVAELPVAKHNCCCFPLSAEEFMVIGGTENTQFSNRVDIARGP
jgi:predicted  nucleic acid-binding Zn-ribbon protein